MNDTTNLKYAILKKDYFSHKGALYKGDKIIIKEITSKGIRATDLGGRIYWFKESDIKFIWWYFIVRRWYLYKIT